MATTPLELGKNGSREINERFVTIDADIAAIGSTYLTGITPGTLTASKAVVVDASSKIDAMDITTLSIDGTAVTASASEINALDITTAGTAEASKAVVLDASKQIDELDITTVLKAPTATPVNAVAASGILTLTGEVIDGETVDINSVDVYEFAADAAQSVSGSNIAVDITSYTTASAGTLTVDTQPTSGEVIVLGTKTFTFVPDGTANADGEISVGTDLASAQTNIVAAINGTDGFNTASTFASAAAFATNASVVTALVGGVAGDSIVSTTTMSGGSNAWDAATLGTTVAGADCTAANAITALVAAEVASGTEPVSFADGAGDTVDVTADVAGATANAITTVATMANGSFGDGTLTGGVDGTVGAQWEVKVDNSYIYVCTAANTITDANWERAAISSY